MSISIEYVLIGKTSSIKIDPIKKKLKDFKEAIIEANPKLKLKLNNVSISYKDKLCDNNDVVLNKIIDSFDKHPKFEVKTTEEGKLIKLMINYKGNSLIIFLIVFLN